MLDGRTVLLIFQVMEQIKKRIQNNRILTTDQNIILKSNYESKKFKNSNFFFGLLYYYQVYMEDS
jgi:hypothetical protein